MKKLATESPSVDRDLSRLRHHIESIHKRGHEIGLHIHPHWEDTRWQNDAWDFSNTRYQLRDFDRDEISDIVARYSASLNELCDGTVTVFRAGGFCVEPFDALKDSLLQHGITVDSSVVPGARLKDGDKGFDFSAAPAKSWWRFDESPLKPDAAGKFIEIPITPLVLPLFYYWARAIDRVRGRQPDGVAGDGMSKAIGSAEIFRRLAGAGRLSELSIDVAKAGHLLSSRVQRQDRDVWQIMGHPKLLGKSSLEALKAFMKSKNIQRCETVSGLASAIRAGELRAGSDHTAQ